MDSILELAKEVGGLSEQAERCISRVGATALEGARRLLQLGIDSKLLGEMLADNSKVYREGIFDQGIMLEKSFQMIAGSPDAENTDAVLRPLANGNEGHAFEFLAVSEAGADGVLLLVAPPLRDEDYFRQGIQDDAVFLDQAGIDFITTTELVQVTSSWRKVKDKVKFWVGDRKRQPANQRTGLADLPLSEQVAWYFAHLKLMAKSTAGEHGSKRFKLVLPKGTLGGIPEEIRTVLTNTAPPGVRDAMRGVGLVLSETRGAIK